MDFRRVNSGAIAGFATGAASGPIYGLTVLAVGGGDVPDADVAFDAGLILGLPWAVLFGCVLAGLPGILFGMAMGTAVGDKPIGSTVVAGAAALGLGGLASTAMGQNDGGLTTAVVLRGAIVGAISAGLWTQIFHVLRSRTPAPADV